MYNVYCFGYVVLVYGLKKNNHENPKHYIFFFIILNDKSKLYELFYKIEVWTGYEGVNNEIYTKQ